MFYRFATHRTDNNDEMAAAIRVPMFATLDDGRRIEITRWAPTVQVQEMVTVTLEGFVTMPEDNDGKD